MNKRKFRNLYNDVSTRVKEEGKINSSWINGFFQGLGFKKLTGYQCAAFVDLLLVRPEEPEVQVSPVAPVVPAVPVVKSNDNFKPAIDAIKRP